MAISMRPKRSFCLLEEQADILWLCQIALEPGYRPPRPRFSMALPRFAQAIFVRADGLVAMTQDWPLCRQDRGGGGDPVRQDPLRPRQ